MWRKGADDSNFSALLPNIHSQTCIPLLFQNSSHTFCSWDGVLVIAKYFNNGIFFFLVTSSLTLGLYTTEEMDSIVEIMLLSDLMCVFYFRVWDVRSGRSIHKLKGHKVFPDCITLHCTLLLRA